MAKIKFKYVGQHQNKGVYEIDEKRVDELSSHSDWERVVYAEKELKRAVSFPKNSWTEAKIAQWLKENKVPIDYDIAKETKKAKLKEIEEHFAV